jgi:hypothetical protein
MYLHVAWNVYRACCDSIWGSSEHLRLFGKVSISRLFLQESSKEDDSIIHYRDNSTGIQADNQVTVTTSENSSAAGNLDASSALHLYGDNYSVWNINIKNTYGAGAQVCCSFRAGFLTAVLGSKTSSCVDWIYRRQLL